jgi:hypothetical protein
MRVNCRFALDEKRNVIDGVNVANSGKAYCHEGDPEDDKYLRERVLMIRLHEMIEKLIINLRPRQKLPSGEEYKPVNEESRSICLAVLNTIRASHLNTFDPTMSIQHKFDGKLRHQKKHSQDFTSLSLFRDEFECLLRDLYGDVESEALDSIVWAVFCIVKYSQNMCVRIYGKSIGTPRTLTTCSESVCQKDVGLAAGSGAAEWSQNTI